MQLAENLAGEQNAAESLLINIDNFASVFRLLLISNAQQHIKYNDKNFSKLCNKWFYIYIYIYIYVCMYVYIYMYVCIYMCTYVYMYIFMYTHVHIIILCSYICHMCMYRHSFHQITTQLAIYNTVQ